MPAAKEVRSPLTSNQIVVALSTKINKSLADADDEYDPIAKS